ncbi:alpha/beta fold hydrolase [Rhizohabitans arisaemae]|uniref:alpha/beta fold hydrolase n=1 Tax=Rhizohabitans arisaemae TaxID=2720610 RepID=UPI0024B24537|nr:alpha/beta hydrolase [Rhizohabitans arisaemae]
MLRYGTVRTRLNNAISFADLGPGGGEEKAPAFLVHPINMRKECWLDLVRVLAAERRCIAVDLAGHGESGDAGDYSLAGWVSDCADVAAALELERFHLVGGSLGGTIALCLAGELPAGALSVTAMGSSLRDEPDPGQEQGADLADLLDTGTVDEMFAVLAAEAVAPGSAASLVATVRHLTSTRGAPAIRRIWHAALSADGTAWTPGVACPVLVITGAFDTGCPPEAGRRMAESVGGRHEILPGTGHLPMLEDAAAVLDLLVPHLESAESKAEAQ